MGLRPSLLDSYYCLLPKVKNLTLRFSRGPWWGWDGHKGRCMSWVRTQWGWSGTNRIPKLHYFGEVMFYFWGCPTIIIWLPKTTTWLRRHLTPKTSHKLSWLGETFMHFNTYIIIKVHCRSCFMCCWIFCNCSLTSAGMTLFCSSPMATYSSMY